jgi:hypothetical protein
MRTDNNGSGFDVSLVECPLCSYEWVAVKDGNINKLECPNCKNIKEPIKIPTDDKCNKII